MTRKNKRIAGLELRQLSLLPAIALLGAVLVVLASQQSYSYPILPTVFYGHITDHNVDASSGTLTAYVNNTLCGEFSIVNSGFYGVLTCTGADNEGNLSSGGIDGENITFEYKNNPTTATGDATFSSGIFKFVNITYPKVVCGDGFCDALENCYSCSADCGVCNATGNATGNYTGGGSTNATTPSGGPSGGSGSGSGGSGGSGGGGSGGAGGYIGGLPPPSGQPPCQENWQCSNWTVCSLIGVQDRNCTDANECGTSAYRPKEIQECIYVGTCSDGIMNCHNNSCELGVDCGGPCATQCPSVEQPIGNITVSLPKFELPQQVCERHVDFHSLAIWIFLTIILISIIARYAYAEYVVYSLRHNERIAPLERARKIRSAKRKTILFSITLFFLTAAAFLYSYYFLECPDYFVNYSWLLALLLVIIPLVVHAAMRNFEYDAGEHIYKSQRLDDVHYQSIVKMIEIENGVLADEESAIANKFYELSRKEEFSNFMESNPLLKDIYKNLVNLYTQYRDKKNPFGIEKDFVDDISGIDLDPKLKKELDAHAELKAIYERLKKLYSMYEEKQKLYEKLDEAENEKSSKAYKRKDDVNKN